MFPVILVLVGEAFPGPVQLWERGAGCPQEMPAPCLPLETQILWSEELVIPVWCQTTLNGSAWDSETMLRTDSNKPWSQHKWKCRGSKTNKLRFHKPLYKWGRGQRLLHTGSGQGSLQPSHEGKDKKWGQTGKLTRLSGLRGEKTDALKICPPEHCTFLPTAVQSQNTVCRHRDCNCFLIVSGPTGTQTTEMIFDEMFTICWLKNPDVPNTGVKTWGYPRINPAYTLPSFIPHRLFQVTKTDKYQCI